MPQRDSLGQQQTMQLIQERAPMGHQWVRQIKLAPVGLKTSSGQVETLPSDASRTRGSQRETADISLVF